MLGLRGLAVSHFQLPDFVTVVFDSCDEFLTGFDMVEKLLGDSLGHVFDVNIGVIVMVNNVLLRQLHHHWWTRGIPLRYCWKYCSQLLQSVYHGVDNYIITNSVILYILSTFELKYRQLAVWIIPNMLFLLVTSSQVTVGHPGVNYMGLSLGGFEEIM